MNKKYTVVELRKICKNKGIKGYSKMKKAELMKYCLETKEEVIEEQKQEVKVDVKKKDGNDKELF